MARLTALSGLGRKSAALFLLEIRGRRLLLDMGDGLETGERPNISGAGRIDAVLLSHAHVDHAGGLDRLRSMESHITQTLHHDTFSLQVVADDRAIPEHGPHVDPVGNRSRRRVTVVLRLGNRQPVPDRQWKGDQLFVLLVDLLLVRFQLRLGALGLAHHPRPVLIEALDRSRALDPCPHEVFLR